MYYSKLKKLDTFNMISIYFYILIACVTTQNEIKKNKYLTIFLFERTWEH